MSQNYKDSISPENYTEDIKNAIEDIKSKMENSLIEYSDNDIDVFQHGNSVYVLANPRLGIDPIFDELGEIKECVPLYNITLICNENRLSFEDGEIKFKLPKIRIIRPDLCIRIDYGS
jgi:hypothetical protein